MSEQVSFLRLARSFFEHELWREPREFSKAEAWLWLLQRAQITDQDVWHGSQCLNLRKGELVAPVRELAKRWNWSHSRVVRFLDWLRKRDMIGTRLETGKTVVLLKNYGVFNNGRDTNRNRGGTEAVQERYTPYIEEGKELEKEIEREAPEMAGGEGIPPVTLEKAQKIAEMRGICTREIVEKWWLINDSKNWEGVRKWESSLKGYAVHMKGVESQNRIKGRGGAAGRNGGQALSRVAKGVGAVAEVL